MVAGNDIQGSVRGVIRASIRQWCSGTQNETINQDNMSSGVDNKPETSRVRRMSAALWTGTFAVVVCQMNWKRLKKSP